MSQAVSPDDSSVGEVREPPARRLPAACNIASFSL
jgi:hypothetical protein